MNCKETNRAVIYVRVSTEDQANEGFSIQAQLADLSNYAESNGFILVNKYIDEGVSGKNISGRSQLKQLLKSAENNQFDVVLIHKYDRLSRDLADLLNIAAQFEKQNVKLISITQPIDLTSAEGRLMFQIVGSFSEFERNTIVKRVKMGMNQRAKQGLWNGGICFGYDVINKELVVNKEEAQIIKEIFELYDKGPGLKKIVGLLNCKGFKSKKGGAFSTTAIKTILENPVYIGKIRFNQHENWSEKRRKGKNKQPIFVDGIHEAIISDDLWDCVQIKRKSRSFRPALSTKPYFLTKLIRCPKCGHAMVSGKSYRDGKTYRYYQCGQYKSKGITVCKAHSINADRAEQQILEELKQAVTEPFFIEKLVNRMNENRQEAEKPILEEKKLLQSKFQKSKSNINNITNKLMADPELLDIFSSKLKEQKIEQSHITKRIEELEKQLQNVSKEPIDPTALRNLLENLESVLEKASAEEKKELLSLFIQDIQITEQPISNRVGRQIKRINLVFDFTIAALQGHTGVLLDKINQINCVEPVDMSFLDQLNPSERSIREALASLSVLPLFMIRFTSINPKRSVNLLYQNKPH